MLHVDNRSTCDTVCGDCAPAIPVELPEGRHAGGQTRNLAFFLRLLTKKNTYKKTDTKQDKQNEIFHHHQHCLDATLSIRHATRYLSVVTALCSVLVHGSRRPAQDANLRLVYARISLT